MNHWMGEMRWPKLGHWGDLGGRLGWGTSHEYNSMLLAQAGLTGQVRVWDDPMSSPRRGHDSPPLLCSAAARGVGIDLKISKFKIIILATIKNNYWWLFLKIESVYLKKINNFENSIFLKTIQKFDFRYTSFVQNMSLTILNLFQLFDKGFTFPKRW